MVTRSAANKLTVGYTHQALRQSLLKKYSRVRRDLDSLHNSRMSAYEKAECLESIRAQIQSSWRTDEIRRGKPTPQVHFAKVQHCLSCILQYHMTHTCIRDGRNCIKLTAYSMLLTNLPESANQL